jgi:uncharacterized protein YecT (DUF1311 family)
MINNPVSRTIILLLVLWVSIVGHADDEQQRGLSDVPGYREIKQNQQQPVINVAEIDESSCNRDGIIDRRCLKDNYQRLNTSLEALYKSIEMNLQADIITAQKELDTASAPKAELSVMDKNAVESAVRMLDWHKRTLSLLQQEQILWKQYRQIACEAAYNKYFGGSLATPSRLWCQIDMTKARIIELNNLYTNEKGMGTTLADTINKTINSDAAVKLVRIKGSGSVGPLHMYLRGMELGKPPRKIINVDATLRGGDKPEWLLLPRNTGGESLSNSPSVFSATFKYPGVIVAEFLGRTSFVAVKIDAHNSLLLRGLMVNHDGDITENQVLTFNAMIVGEIIVDGKILEDYLPGMPASAIRPSNATILDLSPGNIKTIKIINFTKNLKEVPVVFKCCPKDLVVRIRPRFP